MAVSHHFTVDVEEYYQVSALEPYVPRRDWSQFESRVTESVEVILDLLARAGASGTFFVLGMVAERHPELVRRILRSGHEIASHGWGHRRVTHLTPDEFRASVRRTKDLLEHLTGVPVHGFRAPSFSIVPGREWAFDILIEEGHLYDSSLFPVWRRGYGYPQAQRDPNILVRPAGKLLEVPLATLRRLGVNLPAAGGGYFRLLPYGFVRAALRDYQDRGVSGTFYIHPWELDDAQPRLDVSWTTRVRHYGGLSRTVPRLQRLLSEFRFVPIAEGLGVGADMAAA